MNKTLTNFFLSLFLIAIPINNNSLLPSLSFNQLRQSSTLENTKLDDCEKKMLKQIIDELKEQNKLLKEMNKDFKDKTNELINATENNNNFLASLKNSAIGVMSLFLLLTITTFSFSTSR